MVGGALAPTTVIVNGGSSTKCWPLFKTILISGLTPMFEDVGLPTSRPFVASNVAHLGRLEIESVYDCPLGTVTVGVKLYVLPTATEAGGVPLILGGLVDWA
jgi:hypothetical protein